MNQFLYYIIVLPLSKLPLFILYRVSDLLFLVMYSVGYRKKVVFENIRNSFPEKSDKEVKRIVVKFYRHFCDLIIESLKAFSMSLKQMKRMMVVTNPEFLDEFYDKQQNLVMCGGHYGSWELAALGLPLQSQKYNIKGIYTPLKNKFWDEKLKSSRQKSGTKFISQKIVKEELQMKEPPFGVVFLIDQSPGNPDKAFWLEFLNQATPVSFGSEKYAKEFKMPVIYGDVKKVGRGKYTLTMLKISEDPEIEAYGVITKRIHKILEESIVKNPEFYLWTHRKWKHSHKFSGSYDQIGEKG